MGELRRYRKRPGATVTAVQLDLETEGFRYEKWGATQTCKRGDWLVNNGGDTYTIDQETFARTYQSVSPGLFAKQVSVYAEVAETPGAVATKEGATHYSAGDYLVYNDRGRKDGYAIAAADFATLYEPDD